MTRPQRAGRSRPRVSRRRTIALASSGGLAFWAVNFAISLTPVAAEYRSAVSIAYFPMLLEALAGGMVIAVCVSYLLQRFFHQLPPRSPVLKSLALSGAVIVAVTVLVEAPARLLTPPGPQVRYFVIALLFDGLRILALGLAIGAGYERQDRRAQRRVIENRRE